MSVNRFVNGEAKILHAFADTGVECEVLSMYGDVLRVGIDPTGNPFSEVIQSDATNLSLDEHFDLSVWHPPCQRWSIATQGGGKGRDSHPDYIEEAREQAKHLSEYYIIENVPNAPLENPVYLSGEMFGLPLHYERAFETNYHVQQPSSTAIHPSVTDWDEERGKTHQAWIGNKKLWGNVKGYSYDWPAEPLKKSAVPRPYLNYLLRPLIDGWSDGVQMNEEAGSIFDY